MNNNNMNNNNNNKNNKSNISFTGPILTELLMEASSSLTSSKQKQQPNKYTVTTPTQPQLN